MNSSPTPSFPIRLPLASEGGAAPARGFAQGVWARQACMVGLFGTLSLTGLPTAHAHGEADDPLPPEPGVAWQAAAAVTALDAGAELPSRRLRGLVSSGGVAHDRQGLTLEHATATLAARATPEWGGLLSVGKHGAESAHVEAAWLQWRQDGGDGRAWWTVTAGRQTPAQGAVMGQAGHLDRFASMPLVKQLLTDGDWMDDGIQLGYRTEVGSSPDPSGAGRLAWDVGVWRGRAYPAGAAGPAYPTAHGAWAKGAWSVDGWLAWLRPDGRGTLNGTLADHTHATPSCAVRTTAVTCMGGRSRLAGASVQWDGARAPAAWPLTLAASAWVRDEDGHLTSSNGRVAYSGRVAGGWVQALWDWTPAWQAGVRAERLQATQRLEGNGARAVASDLGLLAYQPVSRQALMLTWQPDPRMRVSAEVGRERGADAVTTGQRSTRFAVLRLVLSTH